VKHKCPVDGCEAMVPRSMLMCARHWRLVPTDLQKSVWRGYLEARGSEGHLAACLAATNAVNSALENKEVKS
jgi:hypothetical protein